MNRKLRKKLMKGKWQTALCFAVFAMFLWEGIWYFRDGGRNEPEHEVTIPHYLSEEPLLSKIYDIERNEVPKNRDNFQARELSYFFDYLDVQLMKTYARWGWANFISSIKLLFTILILIMGWVCLRDELKLDRRFSFLVLLLFLTSAPVSNAIYFHRSAKIGVALCLFGYLFSLTRALNKNVDKVSRIDGLALFIALSAGALFDPQGYFILVSSIVLLAIALVVFKERRRQLIFLLSISSVALVVHLLYRYHIAYLLIEHFHGYRPHHGFHELDWPKVWTQMGSGILDATELFADYFGFFFGSLPTALSLAAVVAMVHLQLIINRRIGLLIAGSFMGVIVMIYLMATKVPSVYNEPIRLLYYSLPATALFTFVTAYSIRSAIQFNPKLGTLLGMLLLVLTVHNVVKLKEHREFLDRNNQGSSVEMEAVLEGIRQLKNDKYIAEPAVVEHPVYQSLRASILR